MAEEICFFPFQYDKLQTLAENACGNICNKCFRLIVLSKKKPRSILYNFKTIKKQKLKMRINERKGEILQRIKESIERGAFTKS